VKRQVSHHYEVVTYILEDDDEFPDVTTADGGFCFVEQNGKSYRLHLRVSVDEVGHGRGGEIRANNHKSW